MSECSKCGSNVLQCKCPIIRERKWISKKEAKKIFPSNVNLKKELYVGDAFEDYVHCVKQMAIDLQEVLSTVNEWMETDKANNEFSLQSIDELKDDLKKMKKEIRQLKKKNEKKK